MTRHRWVVEGERGEEGQTEPRMDQYLSRYLGLSRNRITTLLKEGQIEVDGRAPKKSDPVVAGQEISVVVPPPVELEARPEAIPVSIVYQDEELAVIVKPAGLVVHPAPGHPSGTLVNALLHHLGDLSGIGGKLRPGIVHRLDKDTSGLMVVAKTDFAHQRLSAALKAREVQRTYYAALWGALAEDTIEVDQPIERDPGDRKRMTVRPGGRASQTRFRRIESWPTATFCEVDLKTGRTHQIRVHAAFIGHPVVGDGVYGAGRERGFSGPKKPLALALGRQAGRQFLHACKLRFEHPRTGEEMRFEAPLPADLAGLREWALASAL
ncbi:MAG: RluA family pseudouridine synthase [Longimicrobiales bacterium]